MVPGSFQLMKKINTGLILDTIRLYSPISRAEIAKMLNLTPATVTNITAELLRRNIIIESDLGQSTGGRKPVMLKINDKSYYLIAVHIGSTRVRVAIMDMESEILDSKTEKLYENIDFKIAKDILFRLINEMIINNKLEKSKILGIGVSAHGIVNFEKGKIVFAPNFGWKNIPLREILEKEFDVPAFVDRDVRSMALAESWYGEGREVESFICIKVGYGIGAALINNKQQIRGVSDGLGEFGHIKIDINGRKCICGNNGCLEAYASERSVIRYAKENGYLEDLNLDKLNEETEKGNKIVIEAIHKAGHYLGIGISNLINIFNPSLIVIGGDLIDVNDVFFQEMLLSAEKYALSELFEHVKIKRTKTGKDAIIKGAGLLVLDNLFDSIQREVVVWKSMW